MRTHIRQLLKKAALLLPVAGRLLRERDELRRERDLLLRERGSGIVGTASELDRSLYPFPLVHKPRIAFHGNLFHYLSTFANDARCRILEVGSREVVSASLWKHSVPNSDYVGFDVLPGKNVDVVGDAHKLPSTSSPSPLTSLSRSPFSSISPCPGSWPKKSPKCSGRADSS